MEKTTGRRGCAGRPSGKNGLGEREKRRFLQLGVCLVLFLTAFFVKGADRLRTVRAGLAQTIQANGDFASVLAVLDRSVEPNQPAGETAMDLLLGVFLPGEREDPASRRDGPLYQAVRRDMSERSHPASLLASLAQENGEGWEDPMAHSGAMPEPVEPPEPDVIRVDYTGPALPDNTTMDKYALGLEETVMPLEVMRLTSGFGWRDDPLGGGDKFHNGLDLVAAKGTTVRAFAAGTVDFIGESDAYGQYLQIRHANGVTSFYAHCSKLLVHKGDKVELGQKVAESGATGNVTGPHLHFELRKDGVRLNPAYYVDLV